MNSSENCQNCASTDQISIAGKTFCANCGTAAAATANNESIIGGATPSQIASTTQPNIGMAASTDTVAAAPPVPSPNNDDIVNSLTASLSGKPTQPTINASDTATPKNSQTAEQATSSSWVMDTATADSTKPADIASVSESQATPSIPTSPSINKFTPSANITDLRPPNQANSQPASPSLPTQVTAPPSPVVDINIPSSSTPIQPQTQPGNEIASLDSKDEDVFSDDQFNQLSTPTTVRPPEVDNLSTKPTTTPVVVPMDTIRPVTNTITPSQPNQSIPSSQPVVNTPLPAAVTPVNPESVVPSASNTTPGIIQPQTPQQENPTAVAGIPGAIDTPMPAPKKKSSLGKKGAKVATVTLTMAGLLLLGGYVWQVNYPNLALKVASSKAGINASIPGYLPSGWQISNNISSGPGSISYQIGSADGKATATVNESKTDWDSQALAENYVSNKSDKYLSLQAAGLTIYVYGNQASWVNNGTWYRIEGDNTNLSQDQLIRMATSL